MPDFIARIRDIEPAKINCVIGFDGFVDEIVHVVDIRQSAGEYMRLESMAQYGERIKRGAGLSCNVEMVTIGRKLGGNGPILANALTSFGLGVTYIGALGKPDINPVFSELASRAQLLSLCEPAHTDAIEFFDGKIISSKLEAFSDVTWQNILDSCGKERFTSILNSAGIIGFENWTMLPHMNDILRNILTLELNNPDALLFFDIADPEKRRVEDILELVSLFDGFSRHFNVALGLNLKEARQIAAAIGMNHPDASLEELSRYIFSNTKLHVLTIHALREAAAITAEGFELVAGPYCEKPKLTTGAGDNYNAGFLLGLASKLSIFDALSLGVAASGYYVRMGESPTLDQLLQFIDAKFSLE